MRRWLPTAAALTVVIGAAIEAAAAQGEGSVQRARGVFAAALASIRPGTTEQQVLRVLGPPDDVRTETDPGGIQTEDTSKVLRYGTSGHLSCATLGQVYLNRARRVQYVFGGRGAPPAPQVIPESELRSLLSLLHEVDSYNNGDDFNPVSLIRAVNALQAVGREKALAVIGEYLRISSDLGDPAREGTFLVMRTLFDAAPDSGGLPPMRVGVPVPAEPKDPRTAPRFPIILADDIPLLAVSGFNIGGLPEWPEIHLAWFRKHGLLRQRPLLPSNQPLATLDHLLAAHGSDPYRGTILINQLLALLGTVYRADRDADGGRFSPRADFASAWRDLRTRLAKLKIRWDPSALRYVFADGSALPDEPRLAYRRVLWRFKLPRSAGRLVLERQDRRFVVVEVRAPVRHLVVKARGTTGSALSPLNSHGALFENQGRFDSIGSQTIALPEGETVRIEIEAAGRRVSSPELRP